MDQLEGTFGIKLHHFSRSHFPFFWELQHHRPFLHWRCELRQPELVPPQHLSLIHI